MTVPAREVKVGWRVNPGTRNEWTVFSVTPLLEIVGDKADAGYEYEPVMRVPPDQLVDAAPPPRTITVPAMDDETLQWARTAWPIGVSDRTRRWLKEVAAAQAQEAT